MIQRYNKHRDLLKLIDLKYLQSFKKKSNIDMARINVYKLMEQVHGYK